MELFSVTCITCRTKLKVRHPSAIGQILPCPKCGGMVQIVAPAGWVPPQPEASAVATVAPAADVPESPADDTPLTPPSHAAAPGETRLRWMILVGGCLVAAVIIAFGLWSTFSGDDVAQTEPDADAPKTASSSPAISLPSPSAMISPTSTPSPSAAKASATAVAMVVASPTATKPAASPSSSFPAAASSPSAPRPAPSVTPSASPSATPSATKPPPVVAPPPLPPPPQLIDLAARLGDQLPELTFDKLPLKRALDLVSQLSTIRISYDWDSLVDPGVLDKPVTLDLRDRTIAQSLAEILSSAGLVSAPVGDQLLVGPPTMNDRQPTIVEYPIAELLGDDAQAVPRLIDLIRDFVAPETWPAPAVSKAIGVTGTTLVVSQPPAVQRELALFLDRLRMARGKMPRDSKTTLATRLARAGDVLSKPVTMNFRPGEPLPTVLDFLEKASGATITVDYPALISTGFQGDEPIGCAADKHPLADVLTSLCRPREWSWRVVGEKTIDLTTREALRRRSYVEFYKLPKPTEGALSGPDAAQRIRTQLAEEGWRTSGGRGEIVFDEPSQMLIVRQHQGAHLRIEKLLAELNAPPVP